MKKYYMIFLLAIVLNSTAIPQEEFFTAFWNVENLFDTSDDPSRNDSEFLPSGSRNWDNQKFHQKILNLSSVIMSMNNGKGPDLMGLCEIENRAVVESLLVYTAPGYDIVHYESPDPRGIDNALIYRKEKFLLHGSSADTVRIGSGRTRSILEARFTFGSKDTLNIFVNHWTSRSGGPETEQKRIVAAQTLKERVNSISGENNFILIMGDFNDEPENVSLDSVLNAGKLPKEKYLYNLAYIKSLAGEGSYKFRNEWNMLDQIIISDQNNTVKIFYIDGSFDVYKPSFIITEEGKYAGTPKPFFGGRTFIGGYSDHFPVTARFRIEKND